jgi:hypothetical protein
MDAIYLEWHPIKLLWAQYGKNSRSVKHNEIQNISIGIEWQMGVINLNSRVLRRIKCQMGVINLDSGVIKRNQVSDRWNKFKFKWDQDA